MSIVILVCGSCLAKWASKRWVMIVCSDSAAKAFAGSRKELNRISKVPTTRNRRFKLTGWPDLQVIVVVPLISDIEFGVDHVRYSRYCKPTYPDGGAKPA
jgi:hypothetical protein